MFLFFLCPSLLSLSVPLAVVVVVVVRPPPLDSGGYELAVWNRRISRSIRKRGRGKRSLLLVVMSMRAPQPLFHSEPTCCGGGRLREVLAVGLRDAKSTFPHTDAPFSVTTLPYDIQYHILEMIRFEMKQANDVSKSVIKNAYWNEDALNTIRMLCERINTINALLVVAKNERVDFQNFKDEYRQMIENLITVKNHVNGLMSPNNSVEDLRYMCANIDHLIDQAEQANVLAPPVLSRERAKRNLVL